MKDICSSYKVEEGLFVHSVAMDADSAYGTAVSRFTALAMQSDFHILSDAQLKHPFLFLAAPQSAVTNPSGLFPS
jgi:hypothetical protein